MAENSNPKNKLEIVSLKKLLTDASRLKIPAYQRPYRWKAREHVQQLLQDIQYAQQKGNGQYRIGTVILHKNEQDESLDIVDGQQRLVTLSLICHALGDKEHLSLLSSSFDHIDSKNNIKYNYDFIKTYLKRVTDQATLLTFIKNNCSVVKISLEEISEAFQLFDAQNARGKSLLPTNLLKAFHLRLLETETDDTKKSLVSLWEHNFENRNLNQVLGDYIFRLRNWQRQDWKYTFTKAEISEFKGISLSESFKKETVYPYLRVALMNSLSTTFQVHEDMINGKRFFEFSAHYVDLYHRLLCLIEDDIDLKPLLNYWGIHRTGDQRLKNLFLIVLLAYFDKFGKDTQFVAFAKELYRWVFAVRLKQKRIAYQTILNLLKESPNNPLRQLARWYEPDILGLRMSIPKLPQSLDESKFVKNANKIKEMILNIESNE